MFSIVLAAALTSGGMSADWGFKHHRGCYTCWSGCGCYSSCYSCYSGCSCYSCGCSCFSCYSGCYSGCYSSCSCYSCYSGCYGCGGYCYGGGCTGCWSCCGGCSCHGFCHCGCYTGCACSGCGGCCGCGCACYSPVIVAPVAPVAPVVVPHAKAVEAQAPASVVVKADRDAVVTVNGQIAARRSAEETFQTPALVPGRSYTYTVTAELERDGKTEKQTKTIVVRAGERSVADFSELGGEAAEAVAKVNFVVPARTRLFVNDVAVSVEGKKSFDTPKLEKGKQYFYTLKAEIDRDGQTVTEIRRIDVTAGKSLTVDFTRTDATLTASR